MAGRARRRAGVRGGAQRQVGRHATSSSRRSISACSASTSCAAAASRRPSAAPRRRGGCSESVARQLWPGADAVGQVLRLEPDPKDATRGSPRNRRSLSRTVVVVGVARDVAGFRLGGMRSTGAGVYLPISAEAARTSLTLRVHGDAERARRALVDRLAAIDPNMGEVSTLQTIARMEDVSSGDSVLADAGAGRAGAAADAVGPVQRAVVSRRATHAGDRRADGARRDQREASARSSCRSRHVRSASGCSSAAASPPRSAPRCWRRRRPSRSARVVRLFDPVAYAASLLCIVAACAAAALIPALRAGRINPVAALRQD